MGRKEKNVNVTVTPPAAAPQTSIISKRTYTRQVSNKPANQTTESGSEQKLSGDALVDAMNEIVRKKLSESYANDDTNNVQCKDVANGRAAMNAKPKRRSTIGKMMTDTNDVQTTIAASVMPPQQQPQTNNTVSSIAQRPRRQVKHKFIKSANINVIDKCNENSVQNNDVNEPATNSSLTLLNSLSPNNKVRLVPLVHRLPMNATKLNWQEVISNFTTDRADTMDATDDAIETNDRIDVIETIAQQSDDGVDNETAGSIIKEMKTERHKKLSNSKQAIRRGRQLRQTVCPVEPVESNNVHETSVKQQEAEEIVHECIDETTQECTVTDSGLTSAFDDDEDDIMIVEEKDALDVPDQIEYVAEEVVIEETITDNDYTEIVCISPTHFNQDSISENDSSCKEIDTSEPSTSIEITQDNNDEPQPILEPTHSDCDNQTEPIYLSDSLSCFNSDSDAQESEMASTSHDKVMIKLDDTMPDESNTQDENSEIERLNESTDDVIIVPPDYIEPIEVDQSDSEDERFAQKFSFEPFVESDSQPTEDSVTVDDADGAFNRRYDNARLDETTTDADDDSSEVEKRSTRSRRDNVARKNYSIRRTYARRKVKNDSESPNVSSHEPNETKNEDSSSNDLKQLPSNSDAEERLGNRTIETEIKLKMVQDCNTTDGTGTDDESSMNISRAKAVRTYVRKKVSISKLVSCENDVVHVSKGAQKMESDSQSEPTASSSNDAEIKRTINVELSVAPRKRGRPRKKPLINHLQHKSSESDEKQATPSTEDQSQSEAATIDTQIETLEMNEPEENVQQTNVEPEIQVQIETIADINEMPLENDVQDEIMASEVPQEHCTDNGSTVEETQVENTLELMLEESTHDTSTTSTTSIQTIDAIEGNIIEMVEEEEIIPVDNVNEFEIGTEAECMEVECNEPEDAMVTEVVELMEDIEAVKGDSECSSDQLVEGPTIESVTEVLSTTQLTEESTQEEPVTEIVQTEEVAEENVIMTEEPVIPVVEEAPVVVEETTVVVEVAPVAVKEDPVEQEKLPEEIHQEQMNSEPSIVVPEMVETPIFEPSKKETRIAEPSKEESPKPPIDEPIEEKTTVKVEDIAINMNAIVQIPCELAPSVTVTQVIDTKPDVKQSKIKSEEKSQPKSDDVKTQKETELQSALGGLPKEVIKEIEDTSIRRSGRIRTINKTKQRAQGFGLVKDKKRAPLIFDEDSSSFDASTDNTQDKDAWQPGAETKVRAKTDEELEKEKIDRENGMKLFVPIIDNEYRSERTISKEAKKMTCDCFLTQSELERGERGCGDDCLNRMLLIECGPKCIVGDRCTNRRFQKHENSACNIFKTEKKGYGLIATSYISAGQFIMEYVGEVLNSKQFEKRAGDYSKQMNAHYYFMALSSDCVIDATKKGNISRFINHSCDPNAETQKWTVNGELRIGFFSKKPIMPDEEITFDYQFQRYGKEAQKCFCESTNCRGWIGGEPDSEEELESDDDEESEDDATAETAKDDSELSESKVTVAADGTAKKKAKTPKPKKPKDATKKPAKKERAKANRKSATDFKKHMKRAEILEDPDLDKEIDELASGGMKNQVQTLQFSRLMVRAKLQKAKLRLLLLLREGELPCRRLFLDYHGLKLMHSWMSDVNGADRMLSLTFRLEILKTLEKLPITNKTALQDSKVLSTVQRWSTVNEYSFLLNDPQTANNNHKIANATNDESSPSDSGSGTPILNDETASPKVDEMSGSATINPPSHVDTPTAEPTKEPKTILDTPATNTISTGVKPSDVLDAIPQILEQNSTLKGMGVDLLKSIISTTAKNTKIIEDSEKLPDGEMGKLVRDICLLASKLVTTWEQLPESFKIPKKLRIEQMKEHEREADESYKETVEEKTITPKNPTFSSSGRFSERNTKPSDTIDARDKDPRDKDPRDKDPRYRRFNSTLSKHQRRQMFEAKVAQEDAERKKIMENMVHDSRCAFFQLDSRTTRDFMVPICVNPTTGQWFGDKMIKIPTPPSHSHIKPPPVPLPTDINEYHIPPIDLPDLWKYAINEKGQIYYYHTKILIPQWEPPIKLLPLMEEHRINDIDLKVDTIDVPMHSVEEDHEIEHDCDEEDEDVASILSNSTMNPNCLLELKSDPILEKYNDDDSSSTDSDDSLLNELSELEAKYAYIKKKTDDYWMNMKRPPNLNEEIAAMAESDSTGMPTFMDAIRVKDEEKQINIVAKPNSSELKRKRKKNRAQLVQAIRISPLSEEMKRELRRDSRRYKENKAKLRRQKEILLKRKNEIKSSHPDAPVRKLKKITEGLPQVSKHTVDGEIHQSIDNHAFSVGSFSSSRYNSDSFDSKRTKPSAFVQISSGGLSTPSSSSSTSSSLNTSISSLDIPIRALQSTRNNLPSTSLTQSIVNKLPSIGHKFVGDTEELIMKNTIKPIKPAEPVPVPVAAPIINTIRSTPTQQSSSSQQQQQQQLVKKPPHSILTSAKSSPKPMIKKKKTSDPNECIDVNSPAAKKIKEKFKSDISGDIVRHLKPYFSKTCTVGQIQSSDDFRHLARKLTFFVMLKELKYCNNVSLLEVTDSVKNKAREYIKKYMSKFGKTYIRDENEKDYHFEDL